MSPAARLATAQALLLDREARGDVAKMAVLLPIFFGPRRCRTLFAWWTALILMFGDYAPSWLGEPFLPALAAPTLTAQVIHIAMATLSAAAPVVSRPLFAPHAEPAS